MTGSITRRKKHVFSNILNTAAFSPTDIDGLSLFLKPDAGVLADGAARFTAANKEYLSIADSFDLQTGDWTIGGWFYLDSHDADRQLFGQWSNSSGNERAVRIFFNDASDDITFAISSNGSGTTDTVSSGISSISTAKWYFLICRYTHGGEIRIRLRATDDSVWTENTDEGGGIRNSPDEIRMGASQVATAEDYMNGRMDSWFVTKRLTTDAEDDWLYNSGKGRVWDDIENGTGDGANLNDSNLKAWWDLGEGQEGLRFDSKGSNHLTPVGDEIIVNGNFANWTGDNPDNWTVGGEVGADPEISEVGSGEGHGGAGTGACNFYGSVESNSLYITQVVISGADGSRKFTYSIQITNDVNHDLDLSDGGVVFKTINGVATHTGDHAPASGRTNLFIYGGSPDAALDITIDNASWKSKGPVRVDGIAGGAASDVNFATSFNGTTQYLNLPAKNLLNANNAMAYAALGTNIVGGNISPTRTRVVLTDEGIPTDGLPSGVVTAYKTTSDGGGEQFLRYLSFTLANTNKHFFSFYVYLPGTYDGGDIAADFPNFTGGTEGDAVNGSASTTGSWQRVSGSIIAAAGDLEGDLVLGVSGAAPSNGEVQYFTALQIVEEASLTAWDPNALFSPGDQDWWVSVWYRPDEVSTDRHIVTGQNSGAVDNFWLHCNSGPGRFSAGVTNTDIAAAATSMVANTWTHLFAWHSATDNKIGIIQNNAAAVTTSTTGPQNQFTPDLRIGAINTSTSGWADGRIAAVMFGSQAHGWAIGTTTPAALAAALYNDGQSIKTADLTAAQKSSYGLVTGFDLEDDFADDNSLSITLTNNGSLTAGDAQGVDYIAGLVATWQDQSGNSNDFEQTDIDKRPQFHSGIFGTKAGIKFDGVDDLMVKASAFLTGNTGTVFALVHLTAVNNVDNVLASSDEAGTTTYVQCVGYDQGGSPEMAAAQRNADTADVVDGSTTVVVDTDYIMMWQSDGEKYILRLNGNDETVSIRNGGNNGDWFTSADTSSLDNVTIGGRKGSAESNFLAGYISYVIVYDGEELLSADIANVEGWIDDQIGNTIL